MGDLYRAGELFLTSTAGGAMPVANLDGQPVRNGRAGDITGKIRARYWDLHTDPALSFAVGYGDAEGATAHG